MKSQSSAVKFSHRAQAASSGPRPTVRGASGWPCGRRGMREAARDGGRLRAWRRGRPGAARGLAAGGAGRGVDAGEDALPRGPEDVLLLGAEMREEQRADAGEVRRAGGVELAA